MPSPYSGIGVTSAGPVVHRRHRWRGCTIAFAILLVCASAWAAPPLLPRATHAFTILDDATPRTMTTGSTVTVHLRLRNDGTETWTSSESFHVAYHWDARNGEEIIRDGQRTTLPGAVKPGEIVAIDARVETPDTPGVYRLQWDMVQEGVAWFSEQDPRPPAPDSVVVIPGAGMLGATLPPMFALLVWVALRRSGGDDGRGRAATTEASRFARLVSASAGVSDVIWAAASIFGLQLLFFGQAGIIGSPTGIWISAVLAVVPCALVFLCCPRRWRVWMEWSLVLLTAVLLLADLLYVRFFGDMISLAALQASGQAGDVWRSAVSLLEWADLWWVAGLPFGVLLARAVSRLPEPASRVRWTARGAVGLAALLIVVAAGCTASASDLLHDNSLTQVFRNVWLVRDVGPLGFHVFDAWREARDTVLQPDLTPAQRDAVRAWFDGRAGTRVGVGPWFGVARGDNVLIIQVESMQRFVVGLRVGGQEITPNLNRWRREALWFSQATDQTNQGRTSDAEFATMVSLLPLERGAISFRHASNHYVGLPSVLGSHGYTTLSAIPFDGSFWNRLVTHPQYGIDTNLFDEDFAPGEQVGWGLNDRDFFRQMAPRLAALHQPFFAWFITLSLHHPFTSFPDNLKALKLGQWDGTPFGNYLQAMHFFDAALGELETTMKKQGLLDHTVIVVYGDHDAGLPPDPRFSQLVGIPQTPLGLSLADGVPLFIRVPGEHAPRGEQGRPAGLTDVAPTVLALVGVDPAPLPYVGRNLLGHPGDDPLVRPYGSWVDSRHFLITAGQAAGRGQCDDLASRHEVPMTACTAEDDEASQEVDVSHWVTTYDLQQELVKTPSTKP